jgi:hydroxymethylpyrimidine/phosphomethylpyrimidine kinase
MKKVLTIAGFDPSSGAGIARDLDVFFALGIHGLAIPTVLTVQDHKGVHAIDPVPLETFSKMLATLGTLTLDGIKTGVLLRRSYMESVLSFLEARTGVLYVCDPVLQAKNGFSFADDEAVEYLKDRLIARVDVITPNIEEAQRLCGEKIDSVEDMEEAGRYLLHLGAKAVVIKGGHLRGSPVDLLLVGKEKVVYERARLEEEIHGTGCLFSSLMLSFLVLGLPPSEAFIQTEKWVELFLRQRYRIECDGYFYTSSSFLSREAEKMRMLMSMRKFKERLLSSDLACLVPEVQMNVGYALPCPRGVEDVCAFPGRIGVRKGRLYFKGEPEFGSSSHVARLVIQYMKQFPSFRCCANVRYSEEYVRRAKKNGLRVLPLDRRKEPEHVRQREGESLPYLLEMAIEREKEPPDLIYDLGDVGKEPMIRLFGKDPFDVLKKMEMLLS